MARRKPREPILKEFASYEEAAEFWDRHDTTNYLEDVTTVAVQATLRKRRYEIAIDPDIVPLLRRQARRRRLAAGTWPAGCCVKL